MKDFRSLKVWSKAHGLALEVYRVTSRFPQEELYGLSRQLRRAASSIPANIAEGSGRSGKTGDIEFRRFLRIAMGSASELEYHLLLARDLELIKIADHARLDGSVNEVKKMLSSLIRKLTAES